MATSSKRGVRGNAWRKVWLGCGIASSVLYAAMIWAVRYEGYDLISQVPSELTAIGAPTERLWAVLAPVYSVLVGAFGWAVWQSASFNGRGVEAGEFVNDTVGNPEAARPY